MSRDLAALLHSTAPADVAPLDASRLVSRALARRKRRRALVAVACVLVAGPALLGVAHSSLPPSGDRLTTLSQPEDTAGAEQSDSMAAGSACDLPRADADLPERRARGERQRDAAVPSDAQWLQPTAVQQALADLIGRFSTRPGVVGTYVDHASRKLVVVVGTEPQRATAQAAADRIGGGRVAATAIVGCRTAEAVQADLRLLESSAELASVPNVALSVDPPTGQVAVGVPPDHVEAVRSMEVVGRTGVLVTTEQAKPF